MAYKSGRLVFVVGLTIRELSELVPSKKAPVLTKPQ